MADFATQAGHWYAADGSAAYTVLGKNGSERAATLKDARLLGLLPSVTTIIRLAAAPQLEKWKRQQVLLAALTLPRLPDESESAWLVRVERDWQEQGKAAAERGTAIHAAVEKHYRGEQPEPEYWEHVKLAKTAIALTCGEQVWSPERSFAHALGYGGKVDLHSAEWVLDVKSKDFTADNLPVVYDEHAQQIAAYRRGLGVPNAKGGIVWIAANGKMAFVSELDEETLQRGLRMFDSLLEFFYAKTGLKR